MRVTIVDHRGAMERGEEPTQRTVEVGGLAPEVAGGLAAVVLGLPPSWPVPGPGTHRLPKAGGAVVVTLAVDWPLLELRPFRSSSSSFFPVALVPRFGRLRRLTLLRRWTRLPALDGRLRRPLIPSSERFDRPSVRVL